MEDNTIDDCSIGNVIRQADGTILLVLVRHGEVYKRVILNKSGEMTLEYLMSSPAERLLLFPK